MVQTKFTNPKAATFLISPHYLANVLVTRLTRHTHFQSTKSVPGTSMYRTFWHITPCLLYRHLATAIDTCHQQPNTNPCGAYYEATSDCIPTIARQRPAFGKTNANTRSPSRRLAIGDWIPTVARQRPLFCDLISQYMNAFRAIA